MGIPAARREVRVHAPNNGVEIRDWTRVMGRRLSLLIVIPVVAALLAGLLAILHPQTYRATATVILPTQDTGGPLSSAVSQFVSDFEGAITSDGVAQATSETTGEPKSAISNGIATKREGTSGVVEVTYTGTDPDRAGQVAEAASREALAQIAQIQLDVIQAQYDAAKQAYDDALTNWQQVAAETHIVDIDQVKSDFQHRLTVASDELNAVKGTNKEAAAQQHVTEISTRYSQTISDFQRADTRLNGAQASLFFLQGQLSQSQGIVDQAKTNAEITASPARATDRITFVIRRALFAGAFGLLLAIGFIVLLEFLRPSPLNRIRREAGLPTEAGVRRSPGQFVP
jgi:uncharacterized protein involved in exopolysaccharide biosynthesis